MLHTVDPAHEDLDASLSREVCRIAREDGPCDNCDTIASLDQANTVETSFIGRSTLWGGARRLPFTRYELGNSRSPFRRAFMSYPESLAWLARTTPYTWAETRSASDSSRPYYAEIEVARRVLVKRTYCVPPRLVVRLDNELLLSLHLVGGEDRILHCPAEAAKATAFYHQREGMAKVAP